MFCVKRTTLLIIHKGALLWGPKESILRFCEGNKCLKKTLPEIITVDNIIYSKKRSVVYLQWCKEQSNIGNLNIVL